MEASSTQLYTPAEKRGIMVGVIATLVLALVFVGLVYAYKLNVPEHVERDTINIREAQLSEARAKWEAVNASEYELVVSFRETNAAVTHEITIRVNPELEEITLVNYALNGSPTSSPLSEEEYSQFTVENLFAIVEERMDAILEGVPMEETSESQVSYRDLIARFDPSLGYPTFLEDYRRSTLISREIVMREKAFPTLEIKRLSVIR
jgi:hypothetical protein